MRQLHVWLLAVMTRCIYAAQIEAQATAVEARTIVLSELNKTVLGMRLVLGKPVRMHAERRVSLESVIENFEHRGLVSALVLHGQSGELQARLSEAMTFLKRKDPLGSADDVYIHESIVILLSNSLLRPSMLASKVYGIWSGEVRDDEARLSGDTRLRAGTSSNAQESHWKRLVGQLSPYLVYGSFIRLASEAEFDSASTQDLIHRFSKCISELKRLESLGVNPVDSLPDSVGRVLKKKSDELTIRVFILMSASEHMREFLGAHPVPIVGVRTLIREFETVLTSLKRDLMKHTGQSDKKSQIHRQSQVHRQSQIHRQSQLSMSNQQVRDHSLRQERHVRFQSDPEVVSTRSIIKQEAVRQSDKKRQTDAGPREGSSGPVVWAMISPRLFGKGRAAPETVKPPEHTPKSLTTARPIRASASKSHGSSNIYGPINVWNVFECPSKRCTKRTAP